MGNEENTTFNVDYDVEGKGVVLEATLQSVRMELL
jgi:hypothetical protein